MSSNWALNEWFHHNCRVLFLLVHYDSMVFFIIRTNWLNREWMKKKSQDKNSYRNRKFFISDFFFWIKWKSQKKLENLAYLFFGLVVVFSFFFGCCIPFLSVYSNLNLWFGSFGLCMCVWYVTNYSNDKEIKTFLEHTKKIFFLWIFFPSLLWWRPKKPSFVHCKYQVFLWQKFRTFRTPSLSLQYINSGNERVYRFKSWLFRRFFCSSFFPSFKCWWWLSRYKQQIHSNPSK